MTSDPKPVINGGATPPKFNARGMANLLDAIRAGRPGPTPQPPMESGDDNDC